jgi:hypothetical protein
MEEWFLIQFIGREKVEVSQISSMARGKQASNNLSAPEPTFRWKSASTLH